MNKLIRNRLLSAVLAVSLIAVMFVPLASAHDDNGTPDPVTPGDHIKQVIANVGSWNNLFLTIDGNVYVNGSNSAGVYGNGTASTPAAHNNTDGVFQQVLASNGDPLTGINRIFGTSGSAVFAWNDTTKTLYGWGSNGTKRLGITSKANAASVLVPTPVNFYGANIQFDGLNPYAYAASAGTTYVLDTHGDVWSWGLIGISGMTGNINDFRLGREIAFDAAVDITETTIAADTAGNNNGIIKGSESSANGYASIRPGKVEYQTQYPDPGERAIAVGASVGYGAILTNKGNVYSWGGLTLSPAGDRFKKAAHPDAASGRKFVMMSMGGGGVTMLLDDQGKIYTLFMNAAGTSISITAAAATTPVKPAALYANPSIANPDKIKFVHVNAANQGANHASNISFAGFADNGDVYAWGANFLGRAGIGTGGTQLAGYSSTTAIRQSHFEALIDKTSLASTLSANPNFLYDTFSAYSYNGIMLDNKNNRMYTWGTNHYGHLANGIPAATNSVAYQPMPITKPYLKNIPAVAAHAPDGEDPDPGDLPLTDSVANFVFNPPATSATNVLVPSFVGWGGQYNGTLYADISRTVYRVTDENVKNLENKVINLNPQHVRIFYNPRYEMPRPYISGASFGRSAAADENNASFKKVVELAQKSGSTVNVTYWYGPEVNKPIPYNYGDTPADRQRYMQEFAQLIFDLRAAGNTSVQYLTIQNEPKIEFPLEDYQALYQYLHDALVALGIRSQVKLIGGDLLQGSQNAFFQHMDTHMNHILDGYSVHIYWDLGQTGTRDSRLNEVAGIVKNMTNKKPLYVTEYGAKGGNASSPRSMPPFTAFSGNGDNPDPGVAGTGARVSETIQDAYEHAGFNILSATLGYAGLSRWDTYRAKYDSGFQDFSMIAAAYEDYALRPSYWQLLLMTMSTSKGADPIGAPLVWQVIKARAGVDSVKKRAAAFQRSDGETTFMLLNETGADNTAISVENLPKNKTYNVYYWNQNGDGKISVGTPVTPAGTVSNHSASGSGIITVNVNRQAFAIVTTLNLDPTKWDESVGAPPAQTTTPSMIPVNKSIDHPLTVKPYVKFVGALTNSAGIPLTNVAVVTGYINVYRGASAAGERLTEGRDYTVVYTTETVNGKNYSTLTLQFAKPLVSMTDYYYELNANMAYNGVVPYPAMSSKFTTGPVAAFSIPSGAVDVPVNTNLVIDFYKEIWPRVGNISEPMAADAKKAAKALSKYIKAPVPPTRLLLKAPTIMWSTTT